MKIEELLEAVDQLDADSIALLRNHLNARANVVSQIIDTEEWMRLFYQATQSFNQLSDADWNDIEWAMNVEYIEPFVDDE